MNKSQKIHLKRVKRKRRAKGKLLDHKNRKIK